MNAPLIWILTPGILGITLLFFRHRRRLIVLMGMGVALILAGFAWYNPIGRGVTLGPLSIEITDTLTFLGRRFLIDAADAPTLVMIYLGVAFWFGGANIARAHSLFIPAGLGIAALLTAVLAVTPFLYAAILIEMVALVCTPLLFRPTGRGRGVLRFLSFQSLGMPFILFTGWILAGADLGPLSPQQITHAGLLLALGFAFLLGIFPFHTWIPMLAEEANPYIAAFVFFVLSLVLSLFGLGILERFSGLVSYTGIFTVLRLAGSLMAITGGIWAAFQRHVGRMMGYAVMIETGLSLLVLGAALESPGNESLLGLLLALVLPRGLGLGVMALALVTLSGEALDEPNFKEALRFRNIQGKGRRMPIAAGILVLALFSLAGFPMLAGFPVRLVIWEGLAANSLLSASASFLGSIGLFSGALRALTVLVMGPSEDPWQISEAPGSIGLLLLGGFGLLVIGIFPQWFLPAFVDMTNLFTILGR